MCKSIFFFLILYLFVVLGFCCCSWASSSWSKQGLLFIVVHRFLIAKTSLVEPEL